MSVQTAEKRLVTEQAKLQTLIDAADKQQGKIQDLTNLARGALTKADLTDLLDGRRISTAQQNLDTAIAVASELDRRIAAQRVAVDEARQAHTDEMAQARLKRCVELETELHRALLAVVPVASELVITSEWHMSGPRHQQYNPVSLSRDVIRYLAGLK